MIILGFLLPAWGTETGVAVIVKMKGDLQARIGKAPEWEKASKGQILQEGDQLRTGENGLAMIKYLAEKNLLRMKPKSSLTIVGKDKKDKQASQVRVDVGAVLFHLRKRGKKGRFQIKTPTSVATVKGTRFWVIVEEDGKTFVITLENLVELLNLATGKSILVGSGQTGVSGKDGISLRGTQAGDLPDDGKSGQLEIPLIDEDGNPKTLRIELEKTE